MLTYDTAKRISGSCLHPLYLHQLHNSMLTRAPTAKRALVHPYFADYDP